MTWRPWLLSLCALGLILTVANAISDFYDRRLTRAVRCIDAGCVHRSSRRSAWAGGCWKRHSHRRYARLAPALAASSLPRILRSTRRGADVLPIVRNGVERDIVVVAHRASPPNWTGWLFYLGEIWIALCCALIAWRKSNSAEARLLILYLLGVFVVSQGFGDILTPWPIVDQIGLIVKGLIFVPSFIFLALYIVCFATPISAARRVLVAIAIVLMTIATARGIAVRLDLWNGSLSPFTSALLVRADPPVRLFEGAGILAVLLSLFAALGASRGADRTRLLWGLARFVHGRVDLFVDRVFFRSRHQDEEALRTFAREIPYISDRDILLRRAAQPSSVTRTQRL
jgi:hypothetical protein